MALSNSICLLRNVKLSFFSDLASGRLAYPCSVKCRDAMTRYCTTRLTNCHTIRSYSTILQNRYRGKHAPFALSCLRNLSRYTTQSNASIRETDIEKTENIKNGNAKQTGNKFTNWTGKNVWKLGLVFLGGWLGITSFGLVYIWGAPPVDPLGNEVKDRFSDDFVVLAYTRRALNEANIYREMIQNPSSEKLLPDPLQEPYYQPPYTLVLEMTGVLVHPDWTYGTGWRFKKRPNVDAFLQQIGPPLFEVVIYTSEQAYTAFPLVDNLDPNGYIMYRLFRDATRYINGHHVKDLNCLNRDLSKVIMVDWNPESYKLHPRNAVGVKKWMGNDDDKTLHDLANFLRTVALSGVQDVREVLDYYNQFDDPIVAFRENQRRLQEEQQKKAKDEELKKSSTLFSSFARKL